MPRLFEQNRYRLQEMGTYSAFEINGLYVAYNTTSASAATGSRIQSWPMKLYEFDEASASPGIFTKVYQRSMSNYRNGSVSSFFCARNQKYVRR